MKWMNVTRMFGALSQEKTGDFWVNGKLYGGQTCHTSEGVEECDLLVVLGCNPWLARGFNRARNVVNSPRRESYDRARGTRHPAGPQLDLEQLPGKAAVPGHRELRTAGHQRLAFLADAAVGRVQRRTV